MTSLRLIEGLSNLGIQGTPISMVLLCRHRAGAPDAGRYAARGGQLP